MTSSRTPDDKASPELSAVILEGLREAVVATDTQGNIVYANRASRELLGISLLGADEDARRRQARPVYEDHVTPVPDEEAPLVRALRGENVDNLVQWIRVQPDDREMLVSIHATTLRTDDGEISGAVAWFRDITASKVMENELRRLAQTDPLTGAFNRRHGRDRLNAELARRERYGTAVSVLLIDIDHFKAINDRHGHEAGDEALRVMVSRYASLLRTIDVVIRWGGEEFLVILPETGAEGAAATAERLRAGLAADGAQIPFTVSIGVAEAQGGDPDSLLRRADAALYRAKAEGRDRVVVAELIASP
jgi:diguanylate cyclase (GGDEF)-like protein/PAS domain S-box-containing protein